MLGALVGAAGCKRHEEDVKKRDAVNRKITEEDQRMSGKDETAQRDAEHAATARLDEEARREKAEAQRKAGDRAADTGVQDDLAQERAQGQEMLKKNLDAIDRKAEDLSARVAATKGKTRKNAEAAAAEVQSRKATAEANLNSLQSLSGEQWMQKKTEVEQDLAGLTAAVDNLERTLEKK